MFPRLVRFVVASTCVLAGACGSSGAGDGRPNRGNDGGSGEMTPVTTATTPSGVCRFVLVNGTTHTAWVGRARARMNGSGNLDVQCDASAGGSSTLRLGFGNATFDGPRTYQADDFSSDGSLYYAAGPPGLTYDSGMPGASCTLVLGEAPLEASGDSVPLGGRISASFTCKAMIGPRTAEPPSFAVEDGVVAAIVER